MIKLNFLPAVAERDVDLLLVEELSVCLQFQAWFVVRVFGEAIFAGCVGAWHSVNDAALGESDIVFIFSSSDDRRLAVLVENKVNASPQPTQGERYRARGKKGVDAGDWDGFKTCVVAPRRYLESAKNSEIYDFELEYEELYAFFVAHRRTDARSGYKAKVLKEAIEQNRRGYQPVISAENTQFTAEYCKIAEAEYPRLGVQRASPRPAGSTWITFRPEGLTKEVTVAHQLTAGQVKLLVRDRIADLADLQARLQPHFSGQVVFGPAGKSVSISLSVPSIDPITHSASQVVGLIRVALEAVAQLSDGLRSVQGLLRPDT